MIFKATVIAQLIRHVAHLTKMRDPRRPETNDWNDEVAIVCSHNIFSSSDLNAVAREMAALASGSRCKKHYYCVAINPDRPGGTELTDEEAEYSAKRLLQELGFSPDHQWCLVRHSKNGRTHYHVLANSFREVLSRANSKLPRNGTTADQEREILATLTKRRSESPEQIDPCGCDALPSLTIETQMVFVLAIPQGNHRRAFFLSSCGIPPTPLFIAGANG